MGVSLGGLDCSLTMTGETGGKNRALPESLGVQMEVSPSESLGWRACL